MLKAFCLAWALCLCTLTAHAASTYPDQKVVYHINYNDSTRLSATLTNIRNHIDTLGEDHLDLRVVVHGSAIEYFMEATTDSNKQITLDTLRLSGARFIICGNTLDGYGIDRKALYDVTPEDVVQAGLPEIVRLQQQGFSYVSP
ncbi:DsrE family protein [Marinobacterium weihaiense]|uniref:DsrE family protein n=1 Tax=Marinobacterium weihaiense TaxID=2851016 RepID=A0ABS6MAW0_9GAMM|nr:DsrE family protein [Marinobacterium weihaiense]MBV0933428.1 DsrE family protein [Marinobacterium weihaiense]